MRIMIGSMTEAEIAAVESWAADVGLKGSTEIALVEGFCDRALAAGRRRDPSTKLRGQPPPPAKPTGLSRQAIYRIQSDPAWANDVLAAWVA